MKSNKGHNIILILIVVVCFQVACTLTIGTANAKSKIRIGFYNVENLFDTIDDPGSNDTQFTPEYGWNTNRYFSKISQLSQAISIFSPDILGVAEVENRNTLEDLVKKMKGGYAFLHYEGTDPRGIEVALLYKKSRFKVIDSEFLRRVNGSRDILHAVLRDLLTEKEYSIYVSHLPSQIHGKSGNKSRENSIKYLNRKISADVSSNIIVMGDMNQEGLVQLGNLVNVSMFDKQNGKTKGSYRYKGRWEMLDQMLLSDKLRKNVKEGLKVVDAEELIWQNGKNTGSPKKGKPSDHLPVYIDVIE